MSAMLSGELFAGVGGLGIAVDEVFGTRPAWLCEFDAAPSKVLAHRHPGVPNLGDVRAVDFRALPHTHVRAGGFPCQDVSVSGARAGMRDGTRSGLWSEFARSFAEDRPDWVVIENVGGLLSAEAHSDVEPCPWCLGDDPTEPALRALGAVLADLAALGFDAEWTSIRASDVGAPHGRLRVFILAWPAERTVPDASSIGWGEGRTESARPARRPHDELRRAEADLTLLPTPLTAPETGNGHARHLAGEVALLPTPTGNPFEGEPDAFLARRDRLKAQGINGNGAGTPLAIAVQLLPTPRTTDMNGPGAHGDGGLDLRTAVTMMPTPRASRGGSATETMYALGAERVDDERAQGQVVGDITDWGPYTAAIHRWEAATGRAAPAPVRHDGKGGMARLNPELTEWMMGWPAGWVTDPTIGLSRAEQLKACGNGVVPQQAAAALRELLARPGVPAIEDYWADMHMSEADEIAWMQAEHAANPAPFASCPECNRFSRYPWSKTHGTQDGTHEWGGVCSVHGPWRDGS